VNRCVEPDQVLARLLRSATLQLRRGEPDAEPAIRHNVHRQILIFEEAAKAPSRALPDQAAAVIDFGAVALGARTAFTPVRLAAVARSRIESLFDAAGIRIDGCAPTDMRVRDSRVYSMAEWRADCAASARLT
jgi:hypothetical protein